MTETPNLPPAGWYPDPAGGSGERFWDGRAWSQSTRDAAPRPATLPTGTQSHQQPYQQQPSPQRSQPQGQWQQNPSYQPYQRQQMVPSQGNYRIADFWMRLLGFLVDLALMYVIGGIIDLLFGGESDQIFQSYIERLIMASATGAPMPPIPTEAVIQMAVISLVGVLIFAAYRTIMLGTKSATLGQMLVGVRVAKQGDESNAKIGWRDAIVRGALGAVLYNYIPLFMQVTALVTSRRQTVPDLLSKTIVINTREAIS